MRSSLHVLLAGSLALATACGKEGPGNKTTPAASAPAAGSVSTPAEISAPPAATSERWLGEFPAYPGAVKFCGQHISGGSMHISAEFYGTADAPETVAAFYARESKRPADASGPLTSLTGSTEDFQLAWGPVGKSGLPTCDKPPAASDRTVLVVSHATK